MIADLSQQRFRIPLSQVPGTKSGEKGAEEVDGVEDECGGLSIKRLASGSVVFKAFFEFAISDPKYGAALKAHAKALLESQP